MTTIANGKITTDKLYYFQNKAFPNFALNVWCSSKYPADELSNVCLWRFDKTDAAQKWYVRGNDSQCRICPLVGSSSLCLDRYTGTKVGAGINAHLYSYSNTAAFVITDGTCSDTVRIRAIEGGKFLTAYSGANGSKDGRTATSAGNVYFASSALGNLKQEWVPIEVTSSSGGDGDTYTINGKTIPMANWPVGSFWTTDGTPNGTSLSHNNSYECAGFARYVYNYLWGNDYYGSSVSKAKLSGTSEDFKNINIGARINCDKVSDNNNHSMVLVDKTNTEVVVYHANWFENENEYCIIKITHWTYAQFAKKFKNIKSTSYTP